MARHQQQVDLGPHRAVDEAELKVATVLATGW
jgi:hypothetical protein